MGKLQKIKNKMDIRRSYQNAVQKLLSKEALCVIINQPINDGGKSCCSNIENVVGEFERFRKKLPDTIKSGYGSIPHYSASSNSLIQYFSLKGKIKDYVDFDDLFEEYKRNGRELPEGLKLAVLKYCETEICDYATGKAQQFNCFPPDDAQQIAESILLGLSVNATVKMLSRDLDDY